eukprot:14025111-Ditylum_brightwellii.AAC.1
MSKETKSNVDSLEGKLRTCHQMAEEKEVLIKQLKKDIDEMKQRARSQLEQTDNLKSKVYSIDEECVSLREELSHSKDSLGEMSTCRNELRVK